MKQYLDLLRHVMEKGIDRPDRTGTGTRSVFGYQIRFDLREGFPLVTTKKVNIKAVIHELLWFLRGETNIKSLNAVGVHIWDEWADKDGELGPVYGKQWRHWEHSDCDGSHIDQIKRVLEEIAKTPYSRRIIVSAWNPSQVDEMALPPCHTLFQFYVSKDGGLSCHLFISRTSIQHRIVCAADKDVCTRLSSLCEGTDHLFRGCSYLQESFRTGEGTTVPHSTSAAGVDHSCKGSAAV